MRKVLLFYFFVFLVVGKSFATAEPYVLKNIPDSLLKYANVIKVSEEHLFSVNEKNRASYTIKVVYTIMNEKGDRWATFGSYYDKLKSIESIKGTLYDANGKKIRSLKKGDIKDVSATTDNLIDDFRVKEHTFYHRAYPYTVEYEMEMRYKGTMFLPVWQPQESNVMSVVQSSIKVSVPSNNKLKYSLFVAQIDPVISSVKNNTVYAWEIKNIPAVLPSYAAPSWREQTPTLHMATEKFMLEDYEGSNATWTDFGKFVYDLTKGRDELPSEVKQKVASIIATAQSERDKIEKLYRYLQQNSRYISIQLGVGGWQPFDAAFVANRKYGDCKALTNYMFALLKEAGIRSLYTLIRSGGSDNYLIEDLPSSQFNHAVLMVPLQKDTVWLECTSQTMPPGYLGGSTSNRFALAIDETGGTLVRTPIYGAKENLQVRNTIGTIDNNGHLVATIASSYKAVQQDRLHHVVNGLSKDKLKEFLADYLDLPNYDIAHFEYAEKVDIIPELTEKIEITSKNYASISGKRIFVNPNVFSRSYRQLKEEPHRKADVVVSFPFIDIDTVELQLPVGCEPEAMPKDIVIDSEFGKYMASVKLEKDKMIYYRSYEHFGGRFPAAAFPQLIKFYQNVYKADRTRVVLLKDPNADQKKAF